MIKLLLSYNDKIYLLFSFLGHRAALCEQEKFDP